MKTSSGPPLKIGLALVLVLAGVSVLPGLSPSVPLAAGRLDGASRLVSVKQLQAEMCEMPASTTLRSEFAEAVPVNPVTVAIGLQAQQAAAPAQGTSPGRVTYGGQREGSTLPVSRPGDPEVGRKNEVAARRAIRTIRDEYPQYSAVAVDPQNGDIVIQDENLFQIQVFDHDTNTPPTAAMSEPKRFIRGTNTYLELNCAVYIDPQNGNIYSLNNDTERHMTVWDRNARGNASPSWKLHTPMGSFGLAVDEVRQELLITAQHEQIVAAYKKTARDEDPPEWALWGDETLIADPHGIAIDQTLGVFFVANFGSTISPRTVGPDEDPLLVAVARGNMIHGSGRYYPPSITVYNKTARGNTAPIRVITGENTQLNWPTTLFVDAERGELYVSNDGANSILVFDTTADGNATPKRVLQGPQTKLSYPSSVFVDIKNDELWVANMGNHRATVYRRTAEGDTPPLREIRGAPEGTPSPTLANVRIDYDTTRDQILAPN